VALAHHGASESDQRSSGETPLLSTEQTGNSDIATGTDLTISLDNDTSTKVVEDQGLVGLSKSQLPGETGVLDTSPSGGTGTTIVTRDEDVVGLGLGDTRGNDTHTDFGDELDRDSSARVGSLRVVDKLLQVFDRIDIVVRRGGDEADTGGRMTRLADLLRNLVATK
jgi:hypothetical protein